jgi:hypothetical protein
MNRERDAIGATGVDRTLDLSETTRGRQDGRGLASPGCLALPAARTIHAIAIRSSFAHLLILKMCRQFIPAPKAERASDQELGIR